MGIGSLDVVSKDDTSVGCYFNDTHGGCTIEMWDNDSGTNIALNISVKTCVKLRNYLNNYIEEYINIIDEED